MTIHKFLLLLSIFMFYGCNPLHEEAESSDKQTRVSTEKPKQTIEEFSELSSHEKSLLDKLIKVDKQLFTGKTVGSFIKQSTIKDYREYLFTHEPPGHLAI